MDGVRLNSLLAEIAEGAESSRPQFLSALAGHILVVPVMKAASNEQIEKSLEVVKVPTFTARERNLMPAFTDVALFEQWSQGRYDSVTLMGIDISLVMPPATWLVINPGSETSTQISPEELSTLDAASRDDATSVGDGERDGVRNLAESDLRSCFARYPEIEEAYLEPSPSGSGEAVVGLMCSDLKPDRRFMLMAEIAEISRNAFGLAGAIEVFDDLHAEGSRSWDLFKGHSPFYVASRDGEDFADNMGAQVEVSHVNSDTEQPFLSRRPSILGRLFR